MDDEKLNALLSAALYRRDCPDPIVLSDLQAGLLEAEQQQRMQVHIEGCPHCRAELAALGGFLAMPELQPSAGLSWREALGYRWSRLQDMKAILVAFLDQALSPPGPGPAAVAVKGSLQAEESDPLRHIHLSPDETGGVDIEARVLREAPPSDHCQLIVRVQIPERWPELAGVHVRAQAGSWSAEGISDREGEVRFSGFSEADIPLLTFIVTPGPQESP